MWIGVPFAARQNGWGSIVKHRTVLKEASTRRGPSARWNARFISLQQWRLGFRFPESPTAILAGRNPRLFSCARSVSKQSWGFASGRSKQKSYFDRSGWKRSGRQAAGESRSLYRHVGPILRARRILSKGWRGLTGIKRSRQRRLCCDRWGEEATFVWDGSGERVRFLLAKGWSKSRPCGSQRRSSTGYL